MRWGLVEMGYVFVLLMDHALLIRSGRTNLLFPVLKGIGNVSRRYFEWTLNESNALS